MASNERVTVLNAQVEIKLPAQRNVSTVNAQIEIKLPKNRLVTSLNTQIDVDYSKLALWDNFVGANNTLITSTNVNVAKGDTKLWQSANMHETDGANFATDSFKSNGANAAKPNTTDNSANNHIGNYFNILRPDYYEITCGFTTGSSLTKADSGVVFRYDAGKGNAANYYQFNLVPDNNTIKLVLVSSGIKSTLISVPFTFATSTTYTIKVRLWHDTVTCYINGTPYIATSLAALDTANHVGMIKNTGNQTWTFSNFNVFLLPYEYWATSTEFVHTKSTTTSFQETLALSNQPVYARTIPESYLDIFWEPDSAGVDDPFPAIGVGALGEATSSFEWLYWKVSTRETESNQIDGSGYGFTLSRALSSALMQIYSMGLNKNKSIEQSAALIEMNLSGAGTSLSYGLSQAYLDIYLQGWTIDPSSQLALGYILTEANGNIVSLPYSSVISNTELFGSAIAGALSIQNQSSLTSVIGSGVQKSLTPNTFAGYLDIYLQGRSFDTGYGLATAYLLTESAGNLYSIPIQNGHILVSVNVPGLSRAISLYSAEGNYYLVGKARGTALSLDAANAYLEIFNEGYLLNLVQSLPLSHIATSQFGSNLQQTIAWFFGGRPIDPDIVNGMGYIRTSLQNQGFTRTSMLEEVFTRYSSLDSAYTRTSKQEEAFTRTSKQDDGEVRISKLEETEL